MQHRDLSKRKYAWGSEYYNSDLRHLMICNVEKARIAQGKNGGYHYAPYDPKHIWLRENMKSTHGIVRYKFWSRPGYIKSQYDRTHDGVVFRDLDDAMAFKLAFA